MRWGTMRCELFLGCQRDSLGVGRATKGGFDVDDGSAVDSFDRADAQPVFLDTAHGNAMQPNWIGSIG